MGVALLIGLWMYNQYSYDKFLSGYKQVYQVRRNFYGNGDTMNYGGTSLKLAIILRTQIPEIQNVAETDGFSMHGLKVGDKKLYIKGGQVGSDFLKMFQYRLLEGNANVVLNNPYSIVLTQSTAKALFGNEDPINKVVRFGNKNELKVTGVLKDIPSNSTLQFSYLVPFSYLESLGLFGLAAYVAEQRTKESRIRKVLGASLSQVWLLLSKDFIVLELISCVIASPVAFYYMHDWLQEYVYRIMISPVAFVTASAAAIVTTLLTVSFESIKAAMANPVKSLRSE